MNLGHRYRVVRPLGGQAYGGAWLARDLLLGDTCVLKMADADGGDGERLREEANRLGEIDHPRMVRLLTRFYGVEVSGRAGTVTGFATRWMDGVPLTTDLSAAPLPVRMEAFTQLVDAVAYLHTLGMLHLDIKPDNVLYAEGEIVVLDLGSARPLDAGPGDAGGTLGYASPEVVAGQAASIASDIYSMGAVLYELLTGRRPYAELNGSELRFAALSNPVLPVRALAPNTPRSLARLAEDMLQTHAASRPHSAEEVLERLAEVGFPTTRIQGAPPFAGRTSESLSLNALLENQGPTSISVVGPSGSGRSRLIRRALFHWSDTVGWPAVDLSDQVDPIPVVQRLADSNENAPNGERGPQVATPIFLGRREERGPLQVGALDKLTPVLLRAGYRVLWASSQRLPGSRSVVLEPMDADAIAVVGRFLGVADAASLRAAQQRSGGWPLHLVRALAPGGNLSISAPLEEARQLFAILPPGIPTAVLSLLPEGLISQIPALVAARAAWWGEDQKLYLSDENTSAEMSPELERAVSTLLERATADLDPLWYCLLAARQKRFDLARSRYTAALAAGAERPRELAELTRRLAAVGDRGARLGYAQLELKTGHAEEVVRVLGSATDRSAEEDVLLVRALRLVGREAEAEATARAALDAGGPATLWLEIARCCMARLDLNAADDALAIALAQDPSLGDGDGLTLAITLAVRRIDRNEEPHGVDALIARVEAMGDDVPVPSAALSALGRMLIRRGALERGERLLGRAARLADTEGDARRASGIRVNRANALQLLGRGREAREVYQSALLISERAGLADMLLKIRYSLADLELRSGRVPSADVHTRECEQLALNAGDSEARARVALLRGRVLHASGQLPQAREVLEGMSYVPPSIFSDQRVVLAQVLLELGQASDARTLLEATPRPTIRWIAAQYDAILGRTYLATGREALARARAAVPDNPEPVAQFESGEILLAAAGEDLDPATFAVRRVDLGRAAAWLRGDPASRAATLRDRLLDGPGAGLQGIVALAEAIRDPRNFPAAVSRLVAESLGANRVLIMLRMPGLGRVTYTELTGAEAAGISEEVLRRIRNPEDVWVAPDAFADPELRRTSHTVRTFQLRSLLAVAIPQEGRAVGALYVDDIYRANRFGSTEIGLLQRLARAVGGMLPILNVVDRHDALAEPVDMHGVLLTERRDVESVEAAVDVMRKQPSSNLLITGETGAGKTAFAQRLAREVLGLEDVETVVLRKGDPQMLVSALAGARRGEFTGAIDRVGAIHRAVNLRHLLFLDEVQNLDDAGQQILLPLLELPVRYFGGLTSAAHPIDKPLHIVLGTNADVAHGRWREHFRADLWYRMSQVHVHLPPLRDRGPEVVYRYLARMLANEGLPAPEEILETELLERVTRWHWPGNLRELRHFSTRTTGLFRSRGRQLMMSDLPRLIPEDEESATHAAPELPAVDRNVLLDVLARHNYQQNRAAEEMGTSPSQLNKLLKRLDLLDEVKRRRRNRDSRDSRESNREPSRDNRDNRDPVQVLRIR